jgi:ADP-ribosylglycohydrolase
MIHIYTLIFIHTCTCINTHSANFHPGKRAGDLTDTGEVAIMLLEYLTENQQYTFDGYAAYWKKQIDEGYGSCNFQSVGRETVDCPAGLKPGYLNGATRRTLQLLARYPTAKGESRMQLAADTNCLMAATHFLPLFLRITDEQQLVDASISTVYLSHKNRDPLAAADFLSRTMYRIINSGMSLEEALDSAALATGDSFITARLQDAKKKAAEALDPSSQLSKQELADDVALTSMARLWEVGKTEPIKVGKASPTEGALPGSLYIALKYKHSLEEALIANAGVGGDSAVRGMVIGMLLGAVHGREAIPSRWIEGLNCLPHVEAMFTKLENELTKNGEL